MANTFVKATQVVNTALGLLERDVVLPNMVWRDPVKNFAGALNDTVSIRLPAFETARTRVLRSGTAITIDNFAETKVDVTLDTEVYKAIKVTDEEMTLDIFDFSAQVLQPPLAAIARAVEDQVVAEMAGATYHYHTGLTTTDPYLGLVDARRMLNLANVPFQGRGLAVGSNVEAAILKSDRLSKFDQSGSDSALRDATIGRIAGFTAVSAPAMDPDKAIAFHSTAFVLCMTAPVIPASVAWGHVEQYNGFSIRVLQDYDPALIANRLLADLYLGSNIVMDRGTFDGAGRFIASETGTDTPQFVRAVQCNLGGS